MFWDGFGVSPEKILETAIQNKGGEVCEYFFKFGHGTVDSSQSYVLVHINPEYDASTDVYDYASNPVYSFASTEIFNKLCNINDQAMLAGARRLFNSGTASDSLGGASAGNLFEKICLWLVPMTGKTVPAQSLERDGSLTFTFPSIMQILPNNWQSYEDKPENDKLQRNVLYQQRSRNMESVDAFCVIEIEHQKYMLIFVQITVAETHPVKVQGLLDIYDSMSIEVQNYITKKVLLFVTPTYTQLNKKAIINYYGW